MRHAFIDVYANLDSPLHRIDAKTKIIFLLIFLLVIVFTPIRYAIFFIFYGLIIAIMIFLSKTPRNFIFKRIFKILPFIFIISASTLFQRDGFILFFAYALKATLAMLLILIVSSTTHFNQLLESLKQLKVPKIFISLLSFMYRYTFLLEDQLLRTRRAYAARNIKGRNKFKKVRILSNILGTIFIRAYERGEMVYLAMCARGYDNEKSN